MKDRYIFLDVDGVLNCTVFFNKQFNGGGDNDTFVKQSFCQERMSWLNSLVSETGAKVILSSTWRMGRTIAELNDIFKEAGATFNIFDKTPVFNDSHTLRGNEIYAWIIQNLGEYSDSFQYVIIDDDSDMLLCQAIHFFHTDNYSGLTPNVCYKIKKFFEQNG